MKKEILSLFIAFCFIPAGAFSAESKSLMDESFIVETTDSDAMDSLNRISGDIDTGFAPEDAIYRSVHHSRSGPFSTHEDAYSVSSSY